MFDFISDEAKAKVLDKWRLMSETDKAHFINQVAIALSIWGSDEKGKKLVVEVLKFMTENGTSTLADFGIYTEKLLSIKAVSGRETKIKRASLILEGYRIKHSLPSEPHRDISV